jgi:cell division septal protein FtsQ
MSDLQTMMAASAWREIVERRRRRNRARKITLALLGLVALGVLVVVALHGDRIAGWEPLTIRAIDFTDNRNVDRSELLDLLGVSPGDPWWEYDPGAVRRRVEEHPRVADLRIRYAWYHNLRIEVTEREPVLLVLDDPQRELTRDGWCLPLRSSASRLDLPVLHLPSGTSLERGRPVGLREAAVARLVGSLRHERPDLWKQISEVQLVDDHARVYLRANHGMIVFSPGLHEDLWRQVPAVLENLQSRGRGDVVLDLRFTGKIVVHLPEASGADTLDSPSPLDKV